MFSQFCQNLTDYSLQIGMEVEESGETDISACTCLYNNGQVQSKELLPNYASRSLANLSLKDPAGKFATGSRLVAVTTAPVSDRALGTVFPCHRSLARKLTSLCHCVATNLPS